MKYYTFFIFIGYLLFHHQGITQCNESSLDQCIIDCNNCQNALKNHKCPSRDCPPPPKCPDCICPECPICPDFSPLIDAIRKELAICKREKEQNEADLSVCKSTNISLTEKNTNLYNRVAKMEKDSSDFETIKAYYAPKIDSLKAQLSLQEEDNKKIKAFQNKYEKAQKAQDSLAKVLNIISENHIWGDSILFMGKQKKLPSFSIMITHNQELLSENQEVLYYLFSLISKYRNGKHIGIYYVEINVYDINAGEVSKRIENFTLFLKQNTTLKGKFNLNDIKFVPQIKPESDFKGVAIKVIKSPSID